MHTPTVIVRVERSLMPVGDSYLYITAADDQTDADSVASNFLFPFTLGNPVLSLPPPFSPFHNSGHNSNVWHES